MAPGIGHRRSGGRARRQLRADAARPDRRASRRDDHRARPTRRLGAVSREPDVRANITTFLLHLLGKEGAKQAGPADLMQDDEITRETLLTRTARSCTRACKDCSTDRQVRDDVDSSEATRRSAVYVPDPSWQRQDDRPRAARRFHRRRRAGLALHCRLTAGAAELEVDDLDSTNGTFVNGERVARAALRVGDRLGVGARRAGRHAGQLDLVIPNSRIQERIGALLPYRWSSVRPWPDHTDACRRETRTAPSRIDRAASGDRRPGDRSDRSSRRTACRRRTASARFRSVASHGEAHAARAMARRVMNPHPIPAEAPRSCRVVEEIHRRLHGSTRNPNIMSLLTTAS